MGLVIGSLPQEGDRARLDDSCLARLAGDTSVPVTGWITISRTRPGHGGWLYVTGRLDTASVEDEIEVLVFRRNLAVRRVQPDPVGRGGR